MRDDPLSRFERRRPGSQAQVTSAILRHGAPARTDLGPRPATAQPSIDYRIAKIIGSAPGSPRRPVIARKALEDLRKDTINVVLVAPQRVPDRQDFFHPTPVGVLDARHRRVREPAESTPCWSVSVHQPCRSGQLLYQGPSPLDSSVSPTGLSYLSSSARQLSVTGATTLDNLFHANAIGRLRRAPVENT